MTELEKLRIDTEGLVVYSAGLPRFPRNFTRDGILSAILFQDAGMMRDQLRYCANHQGTKKDSETGEEPGKMAHEVPLKPEGPKVRGLSTKYNACDSTALYLLGHEYYKKFTGDKSLIKEQRNNIHEAIKYIIKHLRGNHLFVEDPKFCGADKFGLKVTYWKDSEIHGRDDGEPSYPISYFLAHVQNYAGIRSAGNFLNSKVVKEVADSMKKGIQKFYNYKKKEFRLAIDSSGTIDGASSDALHALFYLQSGDIRKSQVEGIVKTSKSLETDYGYQVLDPSINHPNRTYHAKTIWPFEQALIHIAGKRHNLPTIVDVSSKMVGKVKDHPEMLSVGKGGEIKNGGCEPCLWTIAAKHYFDDTKRWIWD